MAKSKIGGCGGFAGMRMSVGRDAGVGGGRAQGGELLGHGAQFGGGDEGQLDFVGAGCAAAALGGADVFLLAAGRGGGVVRCRRCFLWRWKMQAFFALWCDCGGAGFFVDAAAGLLGLVGRGVATYQRSAGRLRVVPFPLYRSDCQQST